MIHRIIFFALSFLTTYTAYGMEVPHQDISEFVTQLPKMTVQSARSIYCNYTDAQKQEIESNIKAQRNPELSEQLRFISTTEKELGEEIACMYLPEEWKKKNQYLQITLSNLYAQEKEQVETKVKALKNKYENFDEKNYYNYKHFILLRSDLVLLQKHFTLFPNNQISLHRRNCYQGPSCKYKVKHNWQGLKTLLKMVAMEENRFFLLPEYIALITTLFSFGLQKYIKFNFCSSFISQTAIATNATNRVFNETVKKINLQIAELKNSFPDIYDIFFIPTLSEASLINETVFSNYNILKMKLPTVVHGGLSLAWSGLYNSSYAYYTSYFNIFTIRTFAFMAIINTLLFLADIPCGHQLFDDYFSNWQEVIKDIIALTEVYGIVLSLIVLKNMFQAQHCMVNCSQKEINNLLQRTDIEILNE